MSPRVKAAKRAESKKVKGEEKKVKAEGEFEVASIVNHRIDQTTRETEYLVKWKGYTDPREDTWEPESNCLQAVEKLRAYWRKPLAVRHPDAVQMARGDWKNADYQRVLHSLAIRVPRDECRIASVGVNPTFSLEVEMKKPRLLYDVTFRLPIGWQSRLDNFRSNLKEFEVRINEVEKAARESKPFRHSKITVENEVDMALPCDSEPYPRKVLKSSLQCAKAVARARLQLVKEERAKLPRKPVEPTSDEEQDMIEAEPGVLPESIGVKKESNEGIDRPQSSDEDSDDDSSDSSDGEHPEEKERREDYEREKARKEKEALQRVDDLRKVPEAALASDIPPWEYVAEPAYLGFDIQRMLMLFNSCGMCVERVTEQLADNTQVSGERLEKFNELRQKAAEHVERSVDSCKVGFCKEECRCSRSTLVSHVSNASNVRPVLSSALLTPTMRPYDADGRLKVDLFEPSQFHECGERCKCYQLGYKCRFSQLKWSKRKTMCIFRTALMGWGVRTEEPIRKGELLFEAIAEVLTDKKFGERSLRYSFDRLSRCIAIPVRGRFLGVQRHVVYDGNRKSNLFTFVNHSCLPNIAYYGIYAGNQLPVPAAFALRDIRAGEELFLDYGKMMAFFGGQKRKTIVCRCGCANCSGYVF